MLAAALALGAAYGGYQAVRESEIREVEQRDEGDDRNPKSVLLFPEVMERKSHRDEEHDERHPARASVRESGHRDTTITLSRACVWRQSVKRSELKRFPESAAKRERPVDHEPSDA